VTVDRWQTWHELGFEVPRGIGERIQTPALLIDLARVRWNAARMIDALDGAVDRWRPHVKTIKLPALMGELARAGVRHFKAATVREARVLARVLAEDGIVGADVLIAYPLVGPALVAAGRLAGASPHVDVSVLVDTPDAARGAPASLGLFVDLDSGMHRTGIPAGRLDRAIATARAAGSRLAGLHWYDGHAHGLDEAGRVREVERAERRLHELVELARFSGVEVGEVSTTGTASLQAWLDRGPVDFGGPTVHRLSPGTIVLHDLRSEGLVPRLGLRPAAVVLARVVSHPMEDIVTLDAGSKSLAVDAGHPCAIALGWPGLEARIPSEEHLPMQVLAGEPPRRGEAIRLCPAHVCPCVNLVDEVLLVEGGSIRAIAGVAARGHDLLVVDPAAAPSAPPRPPRGLDG